MALLALPAPLVFPNRSRSDGMGLLEAQGLWVRRAPIGGNDPPENKAMTHVSGQAKDCLRGSENSIDIAIHPHTSTIVPQPSFTFKA